MDNMIYILFICIVAPMVLMLFLLEPKSRLTVGFMIIGMFICMFVAQINQLLYTTLGQSMYYTTTTVTPITEEICKALPVLFFAFVFSDKCETLLSISMAVGIGFAILENTYILVSGISEVSLLWALIRGFGAGLMHGICTATVGYGISYVRKRKKLFLTGTFALLLTAIIYHAIYNVLVQSTYNYAGFLLPIATYIPLIIWQIRTKNRKVKVG